MTLLETLQHKIGFTRNEALAILILSGTFLCGICIRWIQSRQAHDAKTIPAFDYTRSDSAYAARSKPEIISKENSTHALAATRIDTPTTHAKVNPLKKTVNINTATKTQLMNLPGIGPSLAERILEYRAINGQFTSVDELRKVKGIGEKKFERIRLLVRMN